MQGREVNAGNSKGKSTHKGMAARRAGHVWKPGVEVGPGGGAWRGGGGAGR